MNKVITILIAFAMTGWSANAQVEKMKLDETKKAGGGIKSPILSVQLKGEIHTPSADLTWRPILTKPCVGFEPQEPDEALIEQIKEQKMKLKQQNEKSNHVNSENSEKSVTPTIGTNFAGNLNSGYSPLDNSVAISNGGIIVSVSNDVINYYNTSGANLYTNDLVSFINDPNVTGVCDPVVLYDPGYDRFIFFCQICPLSTNSKILIFYSETNDPSAGWYYYNLTGDPLSVGDAFDYPKLGISTHELFITGNLYAEPSGTYDQSVIYQIDKLAGYSGTTMNWEYYSNISGSPFTMLPVSYGQGNTYGPGIYLVSTTSSGGSTINFYDITADLANSPAINYYSVSTTAYSIASDANQLGTSCQLNTGSCRTLSGFYLNGIVQFVFHSDYNNTGYHGINYNRLQVSNLTNTSSVFGSSGFDYCYPSVVSYATSATDNSVMIGFGRSGSTIHPEMRVVNCDNNMSWSGSTLVHSSQSYVSYTSTTDERWGDYTGTSRKHNNSTASIWMSGMFGNSSNVWDTWIAEIGNSSSGIATVNNDNLFKVFPNPVVKTFAVNFTLNEDSNLDINIVDVNGKLVKVLYSGMGMAGDNNFSFNKANLSNGTYFLVIKNEKTTFKNEKIIISD